MGVVAGAGAELPVGAGALDDGEFSGGRRVPPKGADGKGEPGGVLGAKELVAAGEKGFARGGAAGTWAKVLPAKKQAKPSAIGQCQQVRG